MVFTFQDWPSEIDRWGDEGAPGIALFGNALQVWSILQNRDTTVAEAAAAFNISASRVEEAVEAHYWLCLGRISETDGTPIIEHEGE